jgi:hypothetical protein
MSVFQVNLTQGVGRTAQGALDPSVVNGASIQRSVWVAGPNKTNRQLFDGATFTDVNYWKRFSYAVTGNYDTAFINVLTDDGSTWNDFSDDNTFPYSYSTVLQAGDTYTTHTSGIHRTQFNILADTGSPAVFTQIYNATASTVVNVRVNGSATAIFPLVGGTTQVFDKGDLLINMLEFDNTNSGAVNTTVYIFLAVQQSPQS